MVFLKEIFKTPSCHLLAVKDVIFFFLEPKRGQSYLNNQVDGWSSCNHDSGEDTQLQRKMANHLFSLPRINGFFQPLLALFSTLRTSHFLPLSFSTTKTLQTLCSQKQIFIYTQLFLSRQLSGG